MSSTRFAAMTPSKLKRVTDYKPHLHLQLQACQAVDRWRKASMVESGSRSKRMDHREHMTGSRRRSFEGPESVLSDSRRQSAVSASFPISPPRSRHSPVGEPSVLKPQLTQGEIAATISAVRQGANERLSKHSSGSRTSGSSQGLEQLA